MGCDFYTNPFAAEDEESQCCREPTVEVTFRRKKDGVVGKSHRCQEHLTFCNDQWELVEEDPS